MPSGAKKRKAAKRKKEKDIHNHPGAKAQGTLLLLPLFFCGGVPVRPIMNHSSVTDLCQMVVLLILVPVLFNGFVFISVSLLDFCS